MGCLFFTLWVQHFTSTKKLFAFIDFHKTNFYKLFHKSEYSKVKDSNADLTIGNWESKIDP